IRPMERNTTRKRAIRRGSMLRAEAPAPTEGERRYRPRPTAGNDIAADGLAAFAPPVRYLDRMNQPPNLGKTPPPTPRRSPPAWAGPQCHASARIIPQGRRVSSGTGAG